MHLDVIGQALERGGEPVPTRDLERHQRRLVQALRRTQRLLDTTDLEHPDLRRTESDRPIERDGVDEAAVVEVLTVHRRGGKQARDRTGGDDRVDHRPVDEPVLGRILDASRHALERHGEVLDQTATEHRRHHLAQTVGVVQVRATTDEGPHAVSKSSVGDDVGRLLHPHPAEPFDPCCGGISGEDRAVERPDRTPEDELRCDAAIDECLQHPDLDRTPLATAAKDERSTHVLDRTGDDSSARLPSVGDIIDAHDVIDAPEETTAVPRIIPNLWFDDQALEAAEFYCSVFPNSRITNISYYGEGGMRPAGMVLTVEFELDGQRHTAINGGPQFTFDEAISFLVDCADQAEVDRYWTALTADGGSEGPCGWCKDRFGLSWQVVPAGLVELLTGPDPARVQRAMAAMMSMTKLDIAAMHAAADAS